jgi:hypothetical protein
MRLLGLLRVSCYLLFLSFLNVSNSYTNAFFYYFIYLKYYLNNKVI